MTSKKNIVQPIIIAILSILLTVSLVLNITGAWFQDYDTTKTTVTIGDPAEIRIANGAGVAGGEFVVGNGTDSTIMPGDKLIGEVNLVTTTKISSEVVRSKFDLIIYEPITNGTIVQYDDTGVSVKDFISTLEERLISDYTSVADLTSEDEGLTPAQKQLIAKRDNDTELLTSMTELNQLWLDAFSNKWAKGIATGSNWYYYQEIVNYEDVSGENSIRLFNDIYFGRVTEELDENDKPIIDGDAFKNSMGYYKFEIKIEVEAMQSANFASISTWVNDVPNGKLREDLLLPTI